MTPRACRHLRRHGARTGALVALAGVTLMSACAPVTSDEALDITGLAGSLASQELNWEDCGFDEATMTGLDTSNVRCATVTVPQDWHAPDPERTFDIRISQATNMEIDNPDFTGVLLMHPGGPVEPGLTQSVITQQRTPELHASTNYVSFDQRGLGQSSSPACDYTWDPADKDSIGEGKALVAACLDDPEVAAITTEQTAYDMDLIRHLLGVPTVDYLGYSYGTWLGTWYANLFPDNVDKMVLDSALDSTREGIQYNYDGQNVARDRQFRERILPWIARQDATHGLGTDPDAIWTRYFDATASPERTEAARLIWYSTNAVLAFYKNVGYPVIGQVVAGLIRDFDMRDVETRGDGADPATIANRVLDGFDPITVPPAALDNSRARLAALAAPADTSERDRTFQSTLHFTQCTDGQWDRGEDYWNSYHEDITEKAPLVAQFGLLDEPPLCAYWPSETTMPAAGENFPETIVVQGEMDALTTWESGHAAGTQLPNTSLIAVDNEGTHGVFPYGTEEVDRPILDFLLGGDRPADIIVADALPLPMETQVYENWAPLDERAEHTADVTDIWQSAGTATPSTAQN